MHLHLSARERIELLLDEDSPFLELCALAGYDQEDMTLGKFILKPLHDCKQLINEIKVDPSLLVSVLSGTYCVTMIH